MSTVWKYLKGSQEQGRTFGLIPLLSYHYSDMFITNPVGRSLALTITCSHCPCCAHIVRSFEPIM